MYLHEAYNEASMGDIVTLPVEGHTCAIRKHADDLVAEKLIAMPLAWMISNEWSINKNTEQT